MDWEKYTGKKSAPVDMVTSPVEYVDDRTVRIVPVENLTGDVCGPLPTSYPPFDEVWESIQETVRRALYGKTYHSLHEGVEMFSKVALRIMYEALTEARDKP